MTTDDEMNDELIERLRRTLRTEAAAIRPNPQSYLAAGTQATPLAHRRWRATWPLALTAAAGIAAAMALVVVTLTGGNGGHRVRIGDTIAPASPSKTTVAAPAVSTPTTLSAPAGTAGTTPPATSSPSTASSPPVQPVPAGFQPAAVTFVSPDDGWTLGTAPCPAGHCLTLARTSDAGQTWQQVSAPDAGDVTTTTAEFPTALSVRFADPSDGWVYDSTPQSGSRLWATHNGGGSWHSVSLPVLASGTIEELEAANHLVQMAVLSQSDGTVHVETSPVSVDDWSDSPTGVLRGAGPVPSTQLVLQGTSGWLIQNDRTVVGGARITGSGHWSSWNAPCAKANGTATLAASSSSDLVAVCNEGTWGPPANIPATQTSQPYPQWIFRSTDGGASFQAVKPLPSTFTANAIATSPSPATVVLAGYAASDGAALQASFDGGVTWQNVYRGAQPTQWKDLGFTTTSQGVAISAGSSGSQLLMTRDGGHSWNPVSF